MTRARDRPRYVLSAIAAIVCACGTASHRSVLVEQYQREQLLAQDNYARGRLLEAMGNYRGALRDAELMDDRRAQMATWISMGTVWAQLEEYMEAAEAYARARELGSEVGDPRLRAFADLGHAETLVATGKAEAAAGIFDSLIGAGSRDAETEARALNGRARAELALGRTDSAAADLERAESLAARSQDPGLLSATLLNRARLLSSRGDTAEALALTSRALELDRARHLPLALAIDLELLGELQARSGDDAAARSSLSRAARLYQLNGHAKGAARVEEALKKLGR
jgi:tetratricopeptide (TPR) repeat protein